MTNLDKLKALHEKWLIGTCDDAEMAQEAVMETHFLALIERVEKAESEACGLAHRVLAHEDLALYDGARISELEAALNDAASKLLTFEREFNRHRMHYGSLEQNDENKVAEYRAGLMERMASKAHDAARTASRARGGDHE